MPTGDIWPQRPAKQESEVCGEGDPHGERAPGTRTTWAGHPATRQSPGSGCGIHTLHAEHALTGSRGNVSESLWESGPNDTHLHHQRDGASEAGGWEGSAPLSPSLSARAAVTNTADCAVHQRQKHPSRCWRLDVQGQGASRFLLHRRPSRCVLARQKVEEALWGLPEGHSSHPRGPTHALTSSQRSSPTPSHRGLGVNLRIWGDTDASL